MTQGKFLKVVFVTLISVLSLVAILYGLMMPKSSDFDFVFLQGHAPFQVGFHQSSDQTSGGTEDGIFLWKEDFSQFEARSTIELLGKGWHKEAKEPNDGFDVATFFDGKGSWIIMINSRIADGEKMSNARHWLRDPKSVNIQIIRRLPPGLWSNLRTRFFATKE